MHYLLLIKHHLEYAFVLLQINKLNMLLLSLIALLIMVIIILSNRQFYMKTLFRQSERREEILRKEILHLKNEIVERTKNLELAIDKSEESNRLKSLFLSNMSHEIRTPLNGIMGFTELIVEDSISPEAKTLYAKHITQSSQNLLKLIDQIFHLSIIETGKVRITKDRFKISDLLYEIETQTKEKIGQLQKPIKLSMNIESPKYEIHTDYEKLKLILENLFDNAIKFTNQGLIELTCLRLENEFLFQISDSGSGINEDEYEFIFDPFTQGEETLRKIKGGSGLGLSNVKSYVILLGGKVWCERNKPNGAIFSFTIPAPLLKENEIFTMLQLSLFQN